MSDLRKADLESQLKTLAEKGCGKCFAQDCAWPECSVKAKALKAALAEPEQSEPFGYVSEHNCTGPYEYQFHKDQSTIYPDNCRAIHKVYAASPRRELLSDEQYFEIGQRHYLPSAKVAEIHKDIETALRSQLGAPNA